MRAAGGRARPRHGRAHRAQRGRDAGRPAGVRTAGDAPSGGGLCVRRRRGPAAGPGSRLDAYATEDPEGATHLRALLEAGGLFPQWTPDDLADDVPLEADRTTVVDAQRPRALGYWIEPLPLPTDWPDAPCVYLRTSVGYDQVLRAATARGWSTGSLELGHFPGFSDPEAAARALLDLLEPLVTDLLSGAARG